MKNIKSYEHTRKVLLHLLAHGLFNDELIEASEYEEWNELVFLAHKHSVEPMIYRGVKRLSNVPDEINNTLRSSAISTALRNEKIMAVQEELLCILEKVDIKCAILKGSSVSKCYPCSGMRILGDIDILISKSNLHDAGSALTDAGYYHSGGHSFHECYERNEVHVELHQAVSDFPETDKGRYTAAYLRDALKYTIVETIDNYYYPVLDVSHQITALLSHMQRHMMNAGIGLRQLCDWAVTLEHYRYVIDDDVLNLLERCGLRHFAEVLTKACTTYLGLPAFEWAEGISNVTANDMMDEIVVPYNMLSSDTNRELSTFFISHNETDKRDATPIRQYIINVNKKVRKEHPHIGVCTLFHPFFWIYYPVRWWIRSIFRKRDKVDVRNTLSIACKRQKLYGDLEIYQ